jgi:putative intracellular protease/amidase
MNEQSTCLRCVGKERHVLGSRQQGAAVRDTVHLHVFDGFADWEAAFAIAGINNPQYQREPGRWRVRTVGETRAMVRSMGGVAVLPDLGLQELHADRCRLLILPGGASWEDAAMHRPVIDEAVGLLDAGVPVAAICGATAGLARAGALDHRPHTSNALRYLKGTGYAGDAHYLEQAAVRAGGLITAGGMAPIEFAREIFLQLELYEPDVLEAWCQLYKTGKSEYFARLVNAAREETTEA